MNSTYPSQPVGFPPSWAASQLSGGGEFNGSVWGAFLRDTANVSTLSNQTMFGPGGNDRCSSRFALSFHEVPKSDGGFEYGGEIFSTPWGPQFGNGSSSDFGEPLIWNFSTSPGEASSIFRNGFYSLNSPPISTCGGPAQTVIVRILGLTTWITFELNDRNLTAPATLPLSEVFDYWFPANFGTWQVDNLSAPGGPGGGWAFSYSPCT